MCQEIYKYGFLSSHQRQSENWPHFTEEETDIQGGKGHGHSTADFDGQLGSPPVETIRYETNHKRKTQGRACRSHFLPGMGKLSFLEQRENALLLSPPRSDGRLFLKTEEGKSTCSLDGLASLKEN